MKIVTMRTITVGLVFVILLMAGLVATSAALAQGPDTAPMPGEGVRWGRMGGHARMGGWIVAESVGEVLMLTPTEIRAARVQGETLAEITRAQAAIDSSLVERIQEAEAAGALTAEQAAWLIAKIEAMCERLENPFAPGGPLGIHRGG